MPSASSTLTDGSTFPLFALERGRLASERASRRAQVKNVLADGRVTHADVAKLGALLWIGAEALAPDGVELSPSSLRDRFREWATRDPIDTIVATVVGGSYLFWLAEKDTNPKCRTFWDALTFIATCLSV